MTFAAVETMNTLLRETLATRRFTLTLLSGFSLAALALAAVGLYGLVSFSVNQRKPEIGIRMALGAGVPSVLALVMRQGMTSAWSGVVAGVVLSLLLTRYLTTLLFGRRADRSAHVRRAERSHGRGQRARLLPAGAPGRAIDPISAIRVD